MPGAEFDVLDECNKVISSIERKADQNKLRARWSSYLLTGLTASVPVFLLIAERLPAEGIAAFVVGRGVPGALAAIAAVLARWIQVEQPHQRWTLYRRWQRVFEAERLRYQQRVGKYRAAKRDEVLAEILAAGQVQLDEEWASLIPRSSTVAENARTLEP